MQIDYHTCSKTGKYGIKDGDILANRDEKIVLGLDIPKTVKQINADIKKLQNQLKTIDGKNINIDKLTADVITLINNLKDFSSKKTGFENFRTEINGVEASLDSLISKLSTVDNVSDLSTIRSQAAALKNTFAELSQTDKIQLSIDNGDGISKYQNKINSLINDFQKYNDSVETAKTQTSSLQQIFNNMEGLSGQELDTQADKVENKEKLTGTLNKLSNSWTEFVNSIIKTDAVTDTVNNINSLAQGVMKLTDASTLLKTMGFDPKLVDVLKNVGRVKCIPSFRICLQ